MYGDRPAALANDLTKKFELVERSTLAALAERYATEQVRGEFVLVVAGVGADGTNTADSDGEEE